jgi:hypothetical protein
MLVEKGKFYRAPVTLNFDTVYIVYTVYIFNKILQAESGIYHRMNEDSEEWRRPAGFLQITIHFPAIRIDSIS